MQLSHSKPYFTNNNNYRVSLRLALFLTPQPHVYDNETCLKKWKPRSGTEPNQTKPNQIRPDQTRPWVLPTHLAYGVWYIFPERRVRYQHASDGLLIRFVCLSLPACLAVCHAGVSWRDSRTFIIISDDQVQSVVSTTQRLDLRCADMYHAPYSVCVIRGFVDSTRFAKLLSYQSWSKPDRPHDRISHF